jgi:fumigallin biosynthesis monooxygenase-like protein
MHVGIRQYWRDLASLLSWARSEPHRRWWRDFLRDSGGTGFWHETYLIGGGMEAVYDDIPHHRPGCHRGRPLPLTSTSGRGARRSGR